MSVLTKDFEIRPTDIDETIPKGMDAIGTVEYLSRLKGRVGAEGCTPDDLIVTADTIVEIDGKVLGKPKDEEQALRDMHLMCGRSHRVWTGVTLTRPGEEFEQTTFAVCTEVTFYPMSDEEIETYVRSDEPYDKAGGYAVQGKAAKFIEKINGDYFNVVGLPLARLRRELLKKGIQLTEG